MPTVRKAITLTEQQNAWIAAQIDAGSYIDDSEVIRDLIRREQERRLEIESIRHALIEGEQSGEPERFDFAAFRQRKAAQHGLKRSDSEVVLQYTVSRADLTERFGHASGTELFERIDPDLRSGDSVSGLTVNAARAALNADDFARPTLVVSGRSGPKGGRRQGSETVMVVISLDDLEAVLKAQAAAFSLAEGSAPRPDLPAIDPYADSLLGLKGTIDRDVDLGI